MTFSFVKPDSGPSPKLDAPTIQTNFDQYQKKFKTNHTDLNKTNQGDHESVILQSQVSTDPGVTQNLCVLYCKDASSRAGTQPQLFVQIPKFLPTKNDTTNAPNNPMQLTYNSVNIAGPVYQSFLVGGYLLYFGSTSNIAVDVILSPAPTKILIAIATAYTVVSAGPSTGAAYDAGTQINTVTNDRFTIISALNGSGPVNPYTFGWMAIGSV